MAFTPPNQNHLINYLKSVHPITINQTPINFVENAEHVGIIRSVHGNLPHIQNRLSSHLKSLFAVLPAGLARNQYANPSATLRIQSVFANPVLFSGIASLTLNKSEVGILHAHHKKTLLNLQKLHKNTPECVVMFLAGNIGATAFLHLKLLCLFGMICRLPENIIHRIALNKLYSEPNSSTSWFVQIRHLCSQYDLPSPLYLLNHLLKVAITH